MTIDLPVNKNRKLVIELQIMVGSLWKKKQCSISNCFPYINNEIEIALLFSNVCTQIHFTWFITLVTLLKVLMLLNNRQNREKSHLK